MEWLTGTTRSLIRYLQPESIPLGLLRSGAVPDPIIVPRVATKRKLRLFCCACCQRLLPVLNATELRVHRLNELLADGQCTEQDVDAVIATNPRPFFDTYVENSDDPGDYAREAVCAARDAVEDVAHLAFITMQMFTGMLHQGYRDF